MGKLDIAKSLLCDAIDLFFKGTNSLSVLSLAQLSHATIISLFEDGPPIGTASRLPRCRFESKQTNLPDIVHLPSSDISMEITDLDQSALRRYLQQVCCDLSDLTTCPPIAVTLYQYWFYSQNPDLLIPEHIELWLEAYEFYPNLFCMNTQAQLDYGRTILSIAADNPGKIMSLLNRVLSMR